VGSSHHSHAPLLCAGTCKKGGKSWQELCQHTRQLGRMDGSHHSHAPRLCAGTCKTRDVKGGGTGVQENCRQALKHIHSCQKETKKTTW
jgi:hypothetical protein